MFTVLTGCFIILMSEINYAEGVLQPGHLLLKIQTWILDTVSSAVHTRDPWQKDITSEVVQLLIDHLRPFILNLTHPKQIPMV